MFDQCKSNQQCSGLWALRARPVAMADAGQGWKRVLSGARVLHGEACPWDTAFGDLSLRFYYGHSS